MSKPFLKWAGGKAKLVPFIKAYMPNVTSKRLVEPFAGGAALTLALDFECYLLNDINRDLINVYQLLKDEKVSFVDYCHSFFTPEFNEELKFYELRERFNHTQDDNEKAALFVYLNRHGFNGLCRYNSKGGFNVPFGRYITPYFPRVEMINFIEKSNRIELINGEFETIFNRITPDDLIYCDPPYVPLSDTSYFTSYAQNGFTATAHERLAQLAEQRAGMTRGIMVSNHDTDFTRSIYQAADIKTIEVQRNIAAKGTSRTKAKEILAIFK